MKLTARAQIGLSFFFIAGFFATLAGEGLGYIKAGTADNLREGVLLVLFFWFQRQRQSPESLTEKP